MQLDDTQIKFINMLIVHGNLSKEYIPFLKTMLAQQWQPYQLCGVHFDQPFAYQTRTNQELLNVLRVSWKNEWDTFITDYKIK